MAFQESDLYAPVRAFLEEQGFVVQAEIKSCDIAATNEEGELIIVELKKAFGLKLVYQALDRQSMTENVYVAIPRPVKGQREKPWKDMLRLLKRLEIGLLTVSIDSPLPMVEVICEAGDSKARRNSGKRARLLKEFHGRQVKDSNVGGVTGKKIMTAYREKAVELCCILEQRGEITNKKLRDMGKEDKYAAILRSNVHHWFVRIERGRYGLSEEGIKVLAESSEDKLVVFYRDLYQKEE